MIARNDDSPPAETTQRPSVSKGSAVSRLFVSPWVLWRITLRGLRRRLHLLAGIAVLPNRAFFAFRGRVLGARNILQCARQHHRVPAWVDERSEVNQNLRSALDVPASMHMADFPLHVRPGRNQNPVVLHDWKTGYGVHRVAFLRSLGGDGLLQTQGHLGACRNHWPHPGSPRARVILRARRSKAHRRHQYTSQHPAHKYLPSKLPQDRPNSRPKYKAIFPKNTPKLIA